MPALSPPTTLVFGTGLFDYDLFGGGVPPGRGGGITIGGELWRTTIDGTPLEDLTDVLVSGFVDWRYDRNGGLFGSDTGTSLMGEFVIRDVHRVTPLVDFLRPYLLLTYDDGRPARREPLGLFLVDLPAEEHTALSGEARLIGQDLTSVLRQAFFTATHTAAQANGFDTEVEAIIEAAGVTRHNIRPTAKTLGYKRVFGTTWSHLAAANKLLHAISYYRLFAEVDGTLTSLPYRSFAATNPSATYTAADPVDVLRIEPRTPVANTVIVRASRPGRATLTSIAVNDDISDPFATVNLGRTILPPGGPVVVNDIEDQASLDALAADLLEEARGFAQVVTLRVLPDPQPAILRTVDLALGGAKAHLDGRYALRAWRVGFVPDDALYEQELHRVAPLAVLP